MAEAQSNSMEEIIEQQKKECPFCKIVSGDIPSIKVYEDDRILAIMDINPAKNGHVLVMPKEHYPLLPWVPREVFKELFKIAKYIARAIEDVEQTPVQMFIANGGAAGQQATHFMIHIFPEMENLKARGTNDTDQAMVEQLRPVLTQNLGIAMNNVAKEDPSVANFMEVKEEQKDDIAALFNENEEFRNMIMTNPDQVKELIKQDPKFEAMFNGIDIDALSSKLREMYGKK